MTACTIELDGRPCGTTTGVRHYLIGHACRAHTPARLAGRPERRIDPALTLEALQQATFARRLVTPDTRPRMGKFGVEVERAQLGLTVELPDPVEAAPPTSKSRPLPLGSGQRAEPTCPGCHRHPQAHGPHCPLGPRARFAMASDGTMVGTRKRGPE